VLSRIFGSNRDEVTGEWRKLHHEKFHEMYSPPKIFRVIKSRIMIWKGHLALLGGREACIGFGGKI
jgi:hypothetical protein